MAVVRLGIENPQVNVATIIATVSDPGLADIIVTNTSDEKITVDAWIVPDNATQQEDWYYALRNYPIPPFESLQSHKFPTAIGDDIYVRNNTNNSGSFVLTAMQEGIMTP